MPDVTPAASAKEAADRKAELDAAMGRGSFKSNAPAPDTSPETGSAPPTVPVHDVTKPDTLAGHIRGILGDHGATMPTHGGKGIDQIIDTAVEGVKSQKTPGDGY